MYQIRMTPKERYLKVKEIFLHVAKLTKEKQHDYISQACADDLALMAEVKELLFAEEEHRQLFNQTAKKIVSPPIFSNKNYLTPGLCINNRYQVESELGRGGFSVVYLAKDLQLNSRHVVVKVLTGTLNNIQQNWQESKFFAEIKALSKINHPNVVSIYDYGLLDNNKPFFVMELVIGDSLRKFISKSTTGLNPKQVIRIIKQIGSALSTTHQLGIYHRDLKPENIMVRQLEEDQEHVEIIDFGIATVKESATSEVNTKSVAGTPAYMAPEQFDGNPSVSSDIYALGIIAYELLTGAPPFDISSYKSLQDIFSNLRRMQKETLMVKPSEVNPNFSSEVDEIFFKVLSYHPQNRYKQVSDFVKTLSKALEKSENNINSWEQLCLMAKVAESSTDNIWFINESMRKNFKIQGTSALQDNISNKYSVNTPLSIVLNTNLQGHLLLLAKDLSKESEKEVVCLCPSLYSANSALKAFPILLPTEGLINNSLPLSKTRGRKQVVAIISQTRLEPSWLKATLETPAQTLTPSDIYILLSKLEKLPANSWFAFYSYVDIF